MSKTLYSHVSLFDGIHNKIINNSWLLVDDNTGKIDQIGQGTLPQGHQVMDLNNNYVMPGMIDAHTHTMLDPDENNLNMVSETEIVIRSLKNLKKCLNAGITTIRECGSAYNVDIKLNHLLNNKSNFPSIVPYGQPMSMTGGHGDFGDKQTNLSYLVDSQDEMRKAVRTAFKQGAQGIKVMASGGVMSANDNVDDVALSMAEIKVACIEAHNRGKKVASHAQGNTAIENSILAGVDSIEHGIFLDANQAEFMSEHNIALVPTLNAMNSILSADSKSLPQYIIDKTKMIQDIFYKNMSVAYQKNVQFIVGTDAGTPFNHFETAVWNELTLLTKIGLTNFEALQSATQKSAILLQIDNDYGTLERNKFADFIVLPENPLVDINAVTNPARKIFKHGQEIMNEYMEL